MLADPRQCWQCAGNGSHSLFPAGFDLVPGATGKCLSCNGTGVLCNLCGKPDGACECPTDSDAPKAVKAEDFCTHCQRVTPSKIQREATSTAYRCKICGQTTDRDYDEI